MAHVHTQIQPSLTIHWGEKKKKKEEEKTNKKQNKKTPALVANRLLLRVGRYYYLPRSNLRPIFFFSFLPRGKDNTPNTIRPYRSKRKIPNLSAVFEWFSIWPPQRKAGRECSVILVKNRGENPGSNQCSMQPNSCWIQFPQRAAA